MFLGKLAYPIYLFSLPIEFLLIITLGSYNFLWIPLTILLTIAISYAINRFIEKPFINLGRRLESYLLTSPSAVAAHTEQNVSQLLGQYEAGGEIEDSADKEALDEPMDSKKEQP